MDGIPPARDTDAEDVVWALQTAEALWKRNERGDAIVWLRRAAQAAGETNDDDRALGLARAAAEMTEWLARSSSAALPTVPPASDPNPSAAVDIDTLLRVSHVDPAELAPAPVSLEPEAIVSDRTPLAEPAPSPIPPAVKVPSAPAGAPPLVRPKLTSSGPERSEVPVVTSSRPPERVLSAAESHAGMLDPWSDAPPSASPAPKPPVPTKPKETPKVAPRVDAPPAPAPPAFDDEVVTSAGPLAASAAAARAPAPSPKPPQAKAPKPPPPKPKSPPPASKPEDPSAPVAAKPIEALDLSAVEAFADLPDDAREGLAKAARVQGYAKGDAMGPFGLVYMVSGDACVMASGIPTPAMTLGRGSVLRARGTLEGVIVLDLVCATESAVAATWTEEAVEAALGACPWVEDELRAAADRAQALAGATLGTLGDRLSPELRANIVNRLTMRAFAEKEVIVTEGVPVPGILLVGAGKVELVLNGAVTGEVKAGQFVLPAEAMSAGPSPSSARAGPGGALLFIADRKVSQELFATEPLLLELFAGW